MRAVLALPRLPGAPDPQGDDETSRIRRVLEQMALRGRDFLRCFDRAGVPRGAIYATGGWARSTALMELRASAFREPITVVDEPELVGLGAALLALEAATGRTATFTPRACTWSIRWGAGRKPIRACEPRFAAINLVFS